jgi:aspartyl-tRNA(Asn)/glutamyl-tRNA(Gln) amidotransferase subunit A
MNDDKRADERADMRADELCELSLTQAAEMIHQGKLSPVELTQAHLERIQRMDASINSYITVTAGAAIQQAHQAELELQRGETQAGGPPGPLHGIPLAIKDLYETQGIRTTAGTKHFSDYIPAEDAVVVGRLKAAGAIFLGKNNLHEIALGLTTVNPHFGTCRNPWAVEHIVGGSSGGSAAALAARFCLGALGSDTGGSIRVPAALCSVVGLKPTYGRVSLRGVIPLSWNLDHAGPMARRVQDTAMLLQVMAGYDPLDPYSVDVPVEDYSSDIHRGVRGWRIALAEDDYFNRTQTEVLEAVKQAARTFEVLGAQVEATPFPDIYQAALANGMMVIGDAATFHALRLLENPGDFGADVLQRLKNGAALPVKDYIQARRTQSLLRRQFARFFESYDLLLMPTTPVAAPSIEGPDAVELARLLTRYTAPFNLTGLPALSLPCGFTSEGLPIGLQIVGPHWGEKRVLRGGHAYEQATDWHNRKPAL